MISEDSIMAITYATYTNPGSREINEDALDVYSKIENSICFILCDGLGGHGMGDVASGLTTKVFGNLFYKVPSNELLKYAFTASQDIVIAEQIRQKKPFQLKTTAVSLCLDDKNAYIGHIGDSRLYAFSHNAVAFRTKDHSVPQMLADCGDIKESEMRYHPDRSNLLRAIGSEWDDGTMFELMRPVKLKNYQAFLLCSDGFWELIEEADMCSLLAYAGGVEEWLAEMISVVKRNGRGRNMDNFSAITVWNT